MTGDFILSIDIGTSATKAVLFGAELKTISVTRKPYPVIAPQRGWSEQDPDEIFNAVLEALRNGLRTIPQGGRLAGVSFSSQMYSLLAVDPSGKPLTHSLTWADTRSAAAAEALRRSPQAAGIYRRTGCPIDPIYPFAKIRWLKENLEIPSQAIYLSIKEYVLFKLTGRLLADWSTASGTGLFDIHAHRWDPAALSLLGLSSDQLSELLPPGTVLSGWRPETISASGLPSGTPLVIGGGDGPLASLGVGATRPDILAVNVGSSAAARVMISAPSTDTRGRLWTYVVDEDHWVIGGIVSNGGIVWDWFLRNLFPGTGGIDTVSSEAERLAQRIPPGADGLLFIPYLGGEQCPAWNASTRGGFWGLDFKHEHGHFSRAVLEGITRSIYRIAETARAALGQSFREVRVTGGLSSSSLWLQIAADMFNLPVLVPDTTEGSARGAALLAAVSLGLSPGYEAFPPQFDPGKCAYPRAEVHSLYQEQYRVFLEILNQRSDAYV